MLPLIGVCSEMKKRQRDSEDTGAEEERRG
jgi:hypothetical protein